MQQIVACPRNIFVEMLVTMVMEQQYQKACSSWSQRRSCFLFTVKCLLTVQDLCRRGSTNRITLPSDWLRRLVRTAIVSSARLRCLEVGPWLCTEEALRSLNPPPCSLYMPPGPRTCQAGPHHLRVKLAAALSPAAPGGNESAMLLSMHRLTHALCPPLEGSRPMGTLQPEDQDPEGWAGHNPANQEIPSLCFRNQSGRKHYIRGSEKCALSLTSL